MLYEEKWLLWVRPITGAGCPKSALTGGKTSPFDFFSLQDPFTPKIYANQGFSARDCS